MKNLRNHHQVEIEIVVGDNNVEADWNDNCPRQTESLGNGKKEKINQFLICCSSCIR